MSDSVTLQQALLRRPVRVVRPRDLKEVYTNPSADLSRLADQALVLHLAHGYYAIPPTEWMGDPGWKPSTEATALGIALADFGADRCHLAGVSAARALGFYPRALASGVVAVPVRRRPVDTVAGRIHFWKRWTEEPETQVWRGELGQGRVTTAEQTLLDVADQPHRGHVSISTAEEVLRSLASAADWEKALQLAESQGKASAYRRARWFAHDLAPNAPRMGRPRHPTASLGLQPSEPIPGQDFWIRDDR